MTGLEEAFMAGMMLAFFTWGVFKIVLMESMGRKRTKKDLIAFDFAGSAIRQRGYLKL